MDWRIKYGIQRALSLTPIFGRQINHVLAERFAGLKNLKPWEVGNALAMVSVLRSQGFDPEGKIFVELGTGWTASAAMTLLGCGAAEVNSFDLYRHLIQKYQDRAMEWLGEIHKHIDRTYPFEPDLTAEASRFQMSRIQRDRFHYFAPHDATDTRLPDNMADCYYSLAVLEHVPKAVIANLLRESFRVLKPGGYCFHYVQPTMHAAWMDKNATGIDYLTCSDWQWRYLYDNDIAHECRLRGVDHIALLKDAGFELVHEWHTIDEKAMSLLPQKRLAPKFRGYTAEEICTNDIWLLGRKPYPVN
jgi:SAM-dependent methyltransferase